MATIDTVVDCGAYTVEFFLDDPLKTPIDPSIFADLRLPAEEFTTLYTEDITKVGLYPIKYRVRLENYPTNVIESPEPFVIEIIDPCSPPTSLVAPALVDQEYTITDTADVY